MSVVLLVQRFIFFSNAKLSHVVRLLRDLGIFRDCSWNQDLQQQLVAATAAIDATKKTSLNFLSPLPANTIDHHRTYNYTTQHVHTNAMGDVNTIPQMEALTSSSYFVETLLFCFFFFLGGVAKKTTKKTTTKTSSWPPPKEATHPQKPIESPTISHPKPKVRQHSANTLASRAALTKLVRARRFLATYGGG